MLNVLYMAVGSTIPQAWTFYINLKTQGSSEQVSSNLKHFNSKMFKTMYLMHLEIMGDTRGGTRTQNLGRLAINASFLLFIHKNKQCKRLKSSCKSLRSLKHKKLLVQLVNVLIPLCDHAAILSLFKELMMNVILLAPSPAPKKLIIIYTVRILLVLGSQ